MEETITREVAELEFDRFVDCMDIDVDESIMDEEDLAAFRKQKNRLVRAIMRGSLIINDDGEAVYTPQHRKSKYKEALTFQERSGGALMGMDKYKKGQDVKKTYAVMAEMCGVDVKTFANLYGIDDKICQAIFVFLMD